MKFLSQLWFPVDPLQQKSFAFIQSIPGSASKCWSPLAAHIWNVTARFLRCVCVCVCVCVGVWCLSQFFFLLDISVPLLSQARLYLGHWWKGMRTKKRGFFLSEGIVCVIGLSKCFISRPQNGCVKFAVQALLNWHWEKSILLKMSGSGAWSFHHSLCISYLKWKKPIDVDLIGPSVIEGLFHALRLSHSHWSQWTLKCDINM